MVDKTCPTCGMTSNKFGANNGLGFEKEGDIYCCRGCAEGIGCTCR